MTGVKPNRRQLQAAATRRDILDASRSLFAHSGFAATTIAQIAESAGVAVQTVYKVFTSKDGLLRGLLDEGEAEARRRSSVTDFNASPDPREQIRMLASFHRQLFEASQDLLGVFRSASARTEMGLLWEEGGARRRRGQAETVRGWHTGGQLRAGLTERRAADQLWAMTDPDLYFLLVVQCGWKPDAYEEWLVATLTEMLLRPTGGLGR
jgi:AcrR family transcriptional regulator